MAVIALNSHQAFNHGADLWIVPDFNHSKLAARIDWFNNFQASRLTRTRVSELSDKLQYILNETEVEPIQIESELIQDILLIGSENQLPNRWTIFLTYNEDLKKWIEEIYKLYLNLKKPSLRIFLPTNLGMNEFTETWRLFSSEEDYSIVVEN